MPEPIDIFADAVHVNVMALGATLQFGLSQPVPMDRATSGASVPEIRSDRIATVRLSVEMLKGLAFLIRQHVLQYEQRAGLRVELPPDLKSGLLQGSDPAEWDRLWGYTS